MMEKEYKYMVCTRCLTYNQESYIEDALRGFTMQEIKFPVVTAIVDDASTDNEPEVLRRWAKNNLVIEDVDGNKKLSYGELIFGHLKQKDNSWFAILLLNENHYRRPDLKMKYISEWLDNAKYQAWCEGDDYWIHPLKLQRQVEFMESHLDYTLCFNNAMIAYEYLDRPTTIFNKIGKDGDVGIRQLIDNWVCPTPGLFVRSSVFPKYPLKGEIISGDWWTILNCAAKGKVWGMKAVMSCYRKTELPASLSNTYANRTDEVFLKKVPILKGLDEYTEGKYHNLISKYIRYYSKMGHLVAFKKKHGMLVTCLLRPFMLLEMVWKRSIRPRLDKNAPTYSA